MSAVRRGTPAAMSRRSRRRRPTRVRRNPRGAARGSSSRARCASGVSDLRGHAARRWARRVSRRQLRPRRRGAQARQAYVGRRVLLVGREVLIADYRITRLCTSRSARAARAGASSTTRRARATRRRAAAIEKEIDRLANVARWVVCRDGTGAERSRPYNSGPPAAGTKGCTPPYTLVRGVTHYKPECL